MVADLNKRLADREVTIKLTSAAKDYIVENGYDLCTAQDLSEDTFRRRWRHFQQSLSSRVMWMPGDEIVIDVDRAEGLVARTEKPVA